MYKYIKIIKIIIYKSVSFLFSLALVTLVLLLFKVSFITFFSNLSLTDEKTHEIVKVLMILTETYFIKEEDKKIFLINVLNIPNEIKDSEFWIKYLEYEINLESKQYENKKYSRYEYIVILSNTTHLKEFNVSKEKIEEVIEYFKNKYKFSNDEYEIIKGQLNMNS